MPNRLISTLSFALLAAVALTACQPADEAPGAAPATAGSAPAATTPSSAAPAGPGTGETCKNVTMILIDGSVEIADNAVKSIDERWSTKKIADELRNSFGDMAGKVSAEAGKVTDPELKAVVDKTAAELAKGAEAANPNGFLDKEFQTVSKDLDKACGA
ncbi:hypothetical protein [Paractinoplanes rishiriensis]|uniref:Uncharacterized protein n=1 Tax=Paractinoplanes rishiriensis TaxID=1050105 RepID=A0A919MW28_9ACTN|nr:hypothetical protein [Actinoplanes rishiriensis]GIE94235.1 hypothetical protein Ari01nite_17000 [Actinoplanes rishiriensis]